jgi:hypothetical protein
MSRCMDGAMAIRRRGPSVLIAGLGALAVLVGLIGMQPLAAPGGAERSSTQADVARLPLAFEPNAGRTDERVDFIARSVAGGTLYLGGGRATLALGDRALRLHFAGANADPSASGLDRLPGEVNSFIGDDPGGWRTGIPTYGAVRYRDVYPGIDVDFHGTRRTVVYDFRLAPGADPGAIAIDARGADGVRLTAGGDLALDVGGQTITQRAPVAYQRIDGERIGVDSAYALEGSTARVRLGPYDRSRPLVIDPTLDYSTYLGGGGDDEAYAIAVDSSGAAYIAGGTDSTDFPAAAGPGSPGRDAFVAKLNPAGTALVYSTYLGGDNTFSDDAFGIAVDGSGSAYVTGTTNSTNFPTVDALQGDQASFDAFVTKLNPAGDALDYSTYYGGGSIDNGNAIALDSSGGAYITGNTTSTNLLVPDAFQGARAGSVDAYVAKLNPHPGPGAVTLGYGTYLGGGGGGFVEVGNGIAVDSSGAAYVTGGTDSATFPTHAPFQGDQPGMDAYVTQLSPDSGGTETLVYSTYLGGDGVDNAFGSTNEQGLAIAVDSAGAAYATGRTDSSNFPTQGPAQGNQPLEDVFVTKLNPAGGGLAYSTYLGGSQNDWGYGIAVAASGEAFVTGITGSSDFPQQDTVQPDTAGDDIFVTQLSSGGDTIGYSTLIGGGGIDWGRGIAVDGSGDAYFAGFGNSTDFPVQPGAQATRQGDAGGDDGVVGKVSRGAANRCQGLTAEKLVTTKPDGTGQAHEIDAHALTTPGLLYFTVIVRTTTRCHVVVRETSAQHKDFNFETTFANLGGLVGEHTVVNPSFKFPAYKASMARAGVLTNTVRVEAEDGQVVFASARINAYSDSASLDEVTSKHIEGLARDYAKAFPKPADKTLPPGDQVKTVEIGVLSQPSKLEVLAKPKCEWLTKQGKFKSVKPDDGACDEPIWIKAKLGKYKQGKTPWSYDFKHELPPGKYIAYARATNQAGVTEGSFDKKIGNEQKFKVKR